VSVKPTFNIKLSNMSTFVRVHIHVQTDYKARCVR